LVSGIDAAGKLLKLLGKGKILKYNEIASSSFICIYSLAITAVMRAQQWQDMTDFEFLHGKWSQLCLHTDKRRRYKISNVGIKLEKMLYVLHLRLYCFCRAIIKLNASQGHNLSVKVQ